MESPRASGSEIAIALSYDGKQAPRVTAKGRGYIAKDVIELARENDVPIRENPELAQLLARIDLGEEIPDLLYVAVAEVIAFAYMIKGKSPGDG